jgi:mannose-6-phosphate isomerase-like protein (cupin superfamily)
MSGPEPLVTDLGALLTAHGDASYREVLRVPALSLGLFAAGAGHHDTQTEHSQDEVYVVLSGAAELEVAGERTPVSSGSVAYVPTGVLHRFVEVTDDLRVIVVFAPPEASEARSG